jgi:hypothetical protein
MNRRSATIIAASLVFALMAGTVSRALTLHQATASAPVRIVVQTPGLQNPPVTTAGFELE